MRPVTRIAPVLMLATLAAPIVSATVAAAHAPDTVIETVRLRNAVPSTALANLQEGLGPKAPNGPMILLPGITKVTPNDTDSTVTVSGTAVAVEEMKALLGLFDVRPRRVQMRVRLVETWLEGIRTSRQKVLHASAFTRNNNQGVMLNVGSLAIRGTKLHMTPHINGDNSITVSVVLTADAPENRWFTESTKIDTSLRIARPGEWQVTTWVSPGLPEPPAGLTGGPKTSASESLLYRVEVTAVEVPAAPTANPQPDNALKGTR